MSIGYLEALYLRRVLRFGMGLIKAFGSLIQPNSASLILNVT